MGATLAVNVGRTSIAEARRELGIIGFDVGLEMSGNGTAFESMLENMYHGGRIALLGILPNDTGIAWDQVIFKGLMLKGIYGREMFETWYKMQTMLQSGLDVLAGAHAPAAVRPVRRRLRGHGRRAAAARWC